MQDPLKAKIARMEAEFARHAQAAEDLYCDIYAVVEDTCGIDLPSGCSPLQAVNIMAELLREARSEIRRLLAH